MKDHEAKMIEAKILLQECREMIYCGIDDSRMDSECLDLKYELLGKMKRFLYGEGGHDLYTREDLSRLKSEVENERKNRQ